MHRLLPHRLAHIVGAMLVLFPLQALAQPFVVNFNVPEGNANWNDENNWADLFVPEAAADELARVASGGTAQITAPVPDVVGMQVVVGAVEILSNGSLAVVPGSGGARGIIDVLPNGRLAIRPGGSLSALDLHSRGTLAVASGSALSTAQSVTLRGIYEIEQVDSVAHQVVSVGENAALGGRLQLSFPSQPSLTVGDSWNLIDAGNIAGEFTSIESDFVEPYRGFATSIVSGGSNGQLLRLTYAQRMMLQVDRATGAVTLTNVVTGAPVDTDGYSIRSTLGSLDSGSLNSLEGQGVGGFAVGLANANSISELQANGSFAVAAGATYSLGNIYSPPVPTHFQQSVEDIVFEHTSPEGFTVRGAVEYVGYGINDLVLQIDPSTGAGVLVNESQFTFAIDSYAITSETGQLLTGWVGADGDWVKSESSSANELSELNPQGGTTFAPGTRLELGTVIDVAAAGGVGLPNADIKLEFLLTDQIALDGDYNNDGIVDLADYTVWRNNVGAPFGTLPNDSTGNTIGAEQYQNWKSAFGTSAIPGEVEFRRGTVIYEVRHAGLLVATSTVPEPASVLLLASGIVCIPGIRRTLRGSTATEVEGCRVPSLCPRWAKLRINAALVVVWIAMLLPATAQGELLAYSGFDYVQSNLGGADSPTDIGFAGPWDTEVTTDLDGSDSLAYPQGVALTSHSGKLADVAGGANTRPLAANAQLDMDGDQDYYFSFLFQQNAARLAVVDLYAGETQVLQIGAGTDRRFRYFMNDETSLTYGGLTEANATYFIVGKIEANASGFDQAYLHIYEVGYDRVGSEPTLWDLHVPNVSLSGRVDNIQVRSATGGISADWALDELRIGTTWDAIAASMLIPGDADGNGNIEMEDFAVILANQNQRVGSGTNGDINFDRVVDFEDFRLWKHLYEPEVNLRAATVPEPGSMTLLAIACGIALSMRWPQRSRVSYPRNFVTQSRGATMKCVTCIVIAMVVGLAAAPANAELHLYTGFDYFPNGTLDGASSPNDIGFDGPWVNDAGDVFLDTSASLPFPQGMTLGSLTGKMADLDGGTADRPVSAAAEINLDLDQDYYFSFLFQQNSARFARVNFYAGATEVMQIGGGSDRRFRLFFNNETILNYGGVTENQQTYLMAGKIEASSSGPDPTFLKIYQVGVDSVGAEPLEWDLSSTTTTLTGLITSVRLQAGTGGASLADWMVDELRVGSSWSDVASEAILGDANGDGYVDMDDFQLISNHFRLMVPPLTNGDLDGDGFVGAGDFRLWKTIYLAHPTSVVAGPTTVPEPASCYFLFALASLSLSWRFNRTSFASYKVVS